jgi:hypothetical protein
MSEGDIYINSTLDGKYGYDVVEWIAEQLWSNQRYDGCFTTILQILNAKNRVSMVGNSYLS